MSTSKFIFVMAVPSSENRAMLSRELLELIQPNAVLILASRAHVIDFDAATEMVLAGRFKLATDVFPIEPLPADHPIRAAEGAILSAHRAGSVAQGMVELGEMVVDDLEALVEGHAAAPLANGGTGVEHALREHTGEAQVAKEPNPDARTPDSLQRL